VRFEEIQDEAAANSIMGSELYLPLELLPKLSGDKFYYHEVIGFELKDKNHGYIGKITGVNDMVSQALFEAEKEGRKLLIPITDDIVVKVDRLNKIIHIDTPEGLVELYLS
jgi:16S rRNA processing protein RimM